MRWSLYFKGNFCSKGNHHTDNCGQMVSQLSRSSAAKPSRGSAMLLLRLCQTGLAQRETQNENTQEWFSTVRKGQQSRPRKGHRVWGKQMLKRNGIFISNINWQRLHNILGRVKTKVTRIAWRRCLENPWRRWRRECELLASEQQPDTTIGNCNFAALK